MDPKSTSKKCHRCGRQLVRLVLAAIPVLENGGAWLTLKVLELVVGWMRSSEVIPRVPF